MCMCVLCDGDLGFGELTDLRGALTLFVPPEKRSDGDAGVVDGCGH